MITRLARLTVLLLGIGLMTACQTPKERVASREDNLAVAGFLARPANTPEREAMLSRLPSHKFVQHAIRSSTFTPILPCEIQRGTGERGVRNTATAGSAGRIES
jgi:hypothetical protein